MLEALLWLRQTDFEFFAKKSNDQFSELCWREESENYVNSRGPIHPARHPETEQFPFLSDITPDTNSDPVLSFQVVSQKGVEFIVAICGNIR